MTGGGGGKKRGLTGEDRSLWDQVAKSIKPLPGRRTKSGREPEALSVEDQISKGAEKRNRPLAVPPVKHRDPPAPPLAPIDRRLKLKLSRGSAEIDAKLDLHGHTQAEAKSRLLRFLETAQSREHSLVLVITGKGKSRDDNWPNEGGVLKRQVPLWLSQPEFRALVIGFEEAGTRHGGAGALYIRVRRRR
ncbi:MAG: Smr/MutS family protein [Xanthobacteraceae bacterium]|jgi:DNA-nicking Smr family endonuclease|nr:Smr/MutS family protein [Xanthobacteraceae bacterium]